LGTPPEEREIIRCQTGSVNTQQRKKAGQRPAS